MTINDDKRKAIITELSARASTLGAKAKHFTQLMDIVSQHISASREDPVELMGLVHALLAQAVIVAYATVGTKMDIQIRTGDDMAELARELWLEGCRVTEDAVQFAKDNNLSIPSTVELKTQLAPSDQSKRPDVDPVDPVAGIPDRPRSVADLISLIDNALDALMPDQKAEQPKDSPVQPATKVPAVWSTGSTLEDCSSLGNGKGN